jgi:pimeloyl-ACP methyl ester carboxylesterase
MFRDFTWPDAIAAAADHLNLKGLGVAGFSAGSPYALVCAAKIPQRITACDLIRTVAAGDAARGQSG